MRRASAGRGCRPYLCQVGCMSTDAPHTCIRPTSRVGSATFAGQLSEGTMTWWPGQHMSPRKTFSRYPTRVLEMRSCAHLLACGGIGLTPRLGDLIGARADPTEWELGNLGGAGADPTEQELGNLNGAGADPTEQELENLGGARADPTEQELGN
ncbi:hypothetical protein BHM03_00044371 [Ensete ventricosum]|nr:hypothetical protein BHM03_00044371 [Ensete ventricosum]